jgi:hypothetical protein
MGVELGKQLANSILRKSILKKVNEHDSSTSFLLNYLSTVRNLFLVESFQNLKKFWFFFNFLVLF